MRSRIEPLKKIARLLRQHRELILNHFRAQRTAFKRRQAATPGDESRTCPIGQLAASLQLTHDLMGEITRRHQARFGYLIREESR